MPGIVWGDVGTRYYEYGIDQGVLYPRIGPPVAWDGLISVSESPSGGTTRPLYYDGFKYANILESEEYEATIEAYSAPQSFNVLDGASPMINGLYLTQQPRKDFDFSYRTKIGNDTDGPNHAYKLHIIYNAIAEPASRNNATLNSSPDAMSLSWNIVTMPARTPGYKPTSHFVIDSRYAPKALLASINLKLYGIASAGMEMDPNFPTAQELISMFASYS